MDVIVVSELIIKLEIIVAILIFCFIAVVLIARAVRARRIRAKLIQAHFVENEVSSDTQGQDSNSDDVSGYSRSSEGQQDPGNYAHQLLEHALVRVYLTQSKLPQWQVELKKAEARIKDDTKEALLLQKYGYINPDIACPYCDEHGKLRTKYIEQDNGGDASKASAFDPLSGGVVPVIPKQTVQAHCGNCGRVWTF